MLKRDADAAVCAVKTAVFVSGGGTNLQALIDARNEGKMPHCALALVLSSRPDAYALQRAAEAGIDTAVCCKKAYAGQAEYEAAILRELDARGIAFIVLAGFLSILSADFTRRYENRIINVHPSLIPAFCGDGYYGLRVHEAALRAGVLYSGATVHFVNEVTDGGRILAQKPVRVLPGDTPETLQQRIMVKAEHVLLPRVAEQICKQLCRGERG